MVLYIFLTNERFSIFCTKLLKVITVNNFTMSISILDTSGLILITNLVLDALFYTDDGVRPISVHFTFQVLSPKKKVQ